VLLTDGLGVEVDSHAVAPGFEGDVPLLLGLFCERDWVFLLLFQGRRRVWVRRRYGRVLGIGGPCRRRAGRRTRSAETKKQQMRCTFSPELAATYPSTMPRAGLRAAFLLALAF